jgi:hypothetical protein
MRAGGAFIYAGQSKAVIAKTKFQSLTIWERGSNAPWREKWSTNRLPRTGLSTGAASCGPGRQWRLRQGLWLVAEEGLVPIRGQSPTLASAQKTAGSA